jgi:hypothetical protein
MSSKSKTLSKKALKEEEEKKALAKAKKAALAKKAAKKPAKKTEKKPIKKGVKKPVKKVKKVKKAKKLVKKAIKKIVKKEVALKDANGAFTDAGWAAQAVINAKAADKKYVKLPAIKTWLKANCDKAQGERSSFWLNKHLLEGIAKLVKGKLIGQLGLGFSLRHLGEEKILGKVFPKKEKKSSPKKKAKAPAAAKAASGKKGK